MSQFNFSQIHEEVKAIAAKVSVAAFGDCGLAPRDTLELTDSCYEITLQATEALEGEVYHESKVHRWSSSISESAVAELKQIEVGAFKFIGA